MTRSWCSAGYGGGLPWPRPSRPSRRPSSSARQPGNCRFRSGRHCRWAQPRPKSPPGTRPCSSQSRRSRPGGVPVPDAGTGRPGNGKPGNGNGRSGQESQPGLRKSSGCAGHPRRREPGGVGAPQGPCAGRECRVRRCLGRAPPGSRGCLHLGRRSHLHSGRRCRPEMCSGRPPRMQAGPRARARQRTRRSAGMPGLLPRPARGGTRDRQGLPLRLAIQLTPACGRRARASSRAPLAKRAGAAVRTR
jgi:hypothetical protein